MTNQCKYAAIDIGSNAMRRRLASAFENSHATLFKKMVLPSDDLFL
jgi:hypothetical protein